MADGIPTEFGTRPKRLASARRFQCSPLYAKQEIRRKLRKVSTILKKKETERTEDEISTLHQLPDIVKVAEKNAKKQLQQKERVLEIEDEPDVLDQKCQQLAQMLLSAENAIVYTGAGISTAASIPDYRGPNGVWTLLKKGQSLRAQDLVEAEPTYTHMCITKLFKEGRVKHLVSQNCDGLHVRSGFPRHFLSEVHGNMLIEICKNCKPQREYLRLFDVTERTAKGRHKTGRTCNKCGSSLYDSIVHFGEKGGLKSPYRWKQATKEASKSDLIICLGSSLKVLRRYACLWRMDMRPEHRPKLVIVNLQWTPKDEGASLKIHGRCDDVLKRMAHHLALTVPLYRRELDPLFRLHTPVQKQEELIANKKVLKTHNHEPVQPAVTKKNIFSNAANGVSSHHLIPLKPEHREGSSGAGIGACLSAPGSASQHLQHVQTSCRVDDQHCKRQETHHSSKKKHILGPIRMKLEQMLKKRGVMNNEVNGKAGGKAGSAKDSVCILQPASCSPLPSIQNFLPQGASETVTQQTHPFLCNLLSCSSSGQSQGQSVNQEHNVFRVDLSTNPISITSTQGYATDLDVEAVPATHLEISDKFSASTGIDCQPFSCSSNSSSGKLVRNIHFDHSYAKTHHKSRPSGFDVNTARDSIPYSVAKHEQQSSHQFLLPSVIPVSSISPDLRVSHENIHFSLSDQDILSTVREVVGGAPATLVLPAGQDCLPHLMNSGINIHQDKVVINLNSDEGFAFQCSYQPYFSAMQSQAVACSVAGAEPSVPCSSSDSTQRHVGSDGSGESDSQSINPVFPVSRKEVASVPGWFGKGLRVRRKRTM